MPSSIAEPAETARRAVQAALLTSITMGTQITVAGATPTEIALRPPSTRIAFTIFAVGVFPMPATYERFHGTMAYDPALPNICKTKMVVDATSLHMDDPARARQALGPDLMDAARFPTMRYEGTCDGRLAVGELTLHGVTRKLNLELTRHETTIMATGTLQRHDFGIDGLPNIVGQEIAIKFTLELPPNLAARNPP